MGKLKEMIKEFEDQGGIIIATGQVSLCDKLLDVIIGFDKEFICPDLYVFHKKAEGLYEDEEFKNSVIGLLIEQGQLPNGTYELIRAELGMQDRRCTVFEGLMAGKEDLLESLAIKNGCENVEDDEEP